MTMAVLDGLPMALQARGIVAGTPHLLEQLREALAGRYRVVCELGRGGMAVVYLAYETALERPVALKVLTPSRAAEPGHRERLLREARTAAKLRHPNIVPIHAVEEASDLVFFTMDYVEGVTLAHRVRARGALPVGEATRILHDVARAVGYAHARGVIHRDLKPDNIMIEAESGRVLVMDFGIAQVGAQGDLDRPGYVTGTVRFMSPERAQGARGDARSDIYALGVTGFFAVTGHVPFDGDTVEDIFSQHAVEPAPALGVYGEHMDLTFSHAVGRCLEKNPDLRFRDGDDLADELARAPELRQRDLPVPLQAFVERLRRYSASSRGLSVLVGAGLIALITGVVTADWQWAGWAAGFLGLIGASTVMALFPMTRRVLRQGYTQADIVHALSVDLERERELRVFEHGRESPQPARIARRVAYAGLGMAGLGAVLSLAESLNPVLGLGAMVYGIVVAMGASVIGALYSRWRENVAGEWWLKFWRSRAGAWAARLGAFRLMPRLGARAQGPPIDVPEGPPVELHLPRSGIQEVGQWVAASHTFETNERD